MTGITGRLAPGARVGDYVLEHAVPARASELAFIGRHLALPRRARVVVIRPELVGDAEAPVEVMREARILESMRHAGVPRVFECGLLADGRRWVAFELLLGPSVAARLSAKLLQVADVIRLLRDVAAILEHAHTLGCVHRAIRPDIITLTAEGLRLDDWSAAAMAGSAIPTSAAADAELYLAPEVAAGQPSDTRSDVYALGAIAYEALARALPTIPARRAVPGAPTQLTVLIDRMLDYAPDARPSSGDVHGEATRLANLLDARLPDDDPFPIEEVEVELVDISRSPPPMPVAPRRNKIKWTPSGSIPQDRPSPPPAELGGTRADASSPRRPRG